MMFTNSDRAKFWDAVDLDSNPDGCWPWTRSTNGDGYGHFYPAGHRVPMRASRAAFALAHGRMPESHEIVCHRCDNPKCCRPSHLFLGTSDDNRRDCISKGRHARRETHGRARLTEESVAQIRSLAGLGVPRRQLAHDFGVGKTTIDRVVHNRTWRAAPAQCSPMNNPANSPSERWDADG